MNQKLKNSPPYHNISMEETEPTTPDKTLVAPIPMPMLQSETPEALSNENRNQNPKSARMVELIGQFIYSAYNPSLYSHRLWAAGINHHPRVTDIPSRPCQLPKEP